MENDKTERARGLGRKKKRGDRKRESNDSPAIPDRRRHQTSPAFKGSLVKSESAWLHPEVIAKAVCVAKILTEPS